jgi:hypothetical protein
MSWLSEESALLAQNWQTFEDICRAEQRLRSELSELLLALESDLRQHEWWHDGWRFVQHRKDQVYISRDAWRTNDEFLLWIGVETFTPERLFGTEPPPQLYVWVASDECDLVQLLAQAIEKRGPDVLGDVDHGRSRYVVKHPIQKCPPGEVAGFDVVVSQQIVAFFSHYADLLTRLDDLIQDTLAEVNREPSDELAV